MVHALGSRLVAAAFLMLLFAGCAREDEAPRFAQPCADGPKVEPAVEAGLITPRVWFVNGSTDHVLVWAHNRGTTPVTIRWCMEFVDGTGVPAAWSLAGESATANLRPNGTKANGPRGVEYPDWKWTLFTIHVPAGTPAGTHAMALDLGAGRHEFNLTIAGTRGRVSHPNDHVELQYDGKFHRNGQSFDDGSFDTVLGSRQTVPGFDYGLMGLAAGESTSLVLPPALGYGYDQTDPDYTKFNGQTLRFDVKILRFL